MAARAFVTRYSNERIDGDNFVIDAYFAIVNPTTYPGQSGNLGVVSVVLNPLDSLAQWQTGVKTAVVAACAALPSPFTVAIADVSIPVLA